MEINKLEFIIPQNIEEKLNAIGYPVNEEEYTTYMEAYQWLWDNTCIKMYPYEEIDGSVSVYWQNPIDGTDDILASSFNDSSAALKVVIDYMADNDMFSKLIDKVNNACCARYTL